MNTFATIMVLLFVGIGAYCIGLHRGFKCYENDYDRGYSKGMEDGMNMALELEENDDERERKAKMLIEQLEVLFGEEDEDEIIDGGSY